MKPLLSLVLLSAMICAGCAPGPIGEQERAKESTETPSEVEPPVEATAGEPEVWTTRSAHGLVRLVRERRMEAVEPTGRLDAWFTRIASEVSPRPPIGRCFHRAPSEALRGAVDAGALQIDPGHRGQGIPVLPDELHHYSSVLGPDVLGEGASALVSVSGGTIAAFTHRIGWASSKSATTLTARRTAEGDIALAWDAAGHQSGHDALLVTILASADDPTVLFSCSLDPASGGDVVGARAFQSAGAAKLAALSTIKLGVPQC